MPSATSRGTIEKTGGRYYFYTTAAVISESYDPELLWIEERGFLKFGGTSSASSITLSFTASVTLTGLSSVQLRIARIPDYEPLDSTDWNSTPYAAKTYTVYTSGTNIQFSIDVTDLGYSATSNCYRLSVATTLNTNQSVDIQISPGTETISYVSQQSRSASYDILVDNSVINGAVADLASASGAIVTNGSVSECYVSRYLNNQTKNVAIIGDVLLAGTPNAIFNRAAGYDVVVYIPVIDAIRSGLRYSSAGENVSVTHSNPVAHRALPRISSYDIAVDTSCSSNLYRIVDISGSIVTDGAVNLYLMVECIGEILTETLRADVAIETQCSISGSIDFSASVDTVLYKFISITDGFVLEGSVIVGNYYDVAITGEIIFDADVYAYISRVEPVGPFILKSSRVTDLDYVSSVPNHFAEMENSIAGLLGLNFGTYSGRRVAKYSEGVTFGSQHDHVNGRGGAISHGNLDFGGYTPQYSHAQIDQHINSPNPHSEFEVLANRDVNNGYAGLTSYNVISVDRINLQFIESGYNPRLYLYLRDPVVTNGTAMWWGVAGILYNYYSSSGFSGDEPFVLQIDGGYYGIAYNTQSTIWDVNRIFKDGIVLLRLKEMSVSGFSTISLGNEIPINTGSGYTCSCVVKYFVGSGLGSLRPPLAINGINSYSPSSSLWFLFCEATGG